MKKLLAVMVAALVIAGAVAFTGPRTEAASISRPAVTGQHHVVPFYWSGWRNWDGTWCTGLFSDSGALYWFYCQ